ncbi:MAG: hypothetical protein KKD28_06355 [Chloroflexi bacterium]|nr:hypothetical protein [Chloroflexota bacterium]
MKCEHWEEAGYTAEVSVTGLIWAITAPAPSTAGLLAIGAGDGAVSGVARQFCGLLEKDCQTSEYQQQSFHP